MDYSLLFIKAVVQSENQQFKRMPAMIFNKDEEELQLKKADSYQINETSKSNELEEEIKEEDEVDVQK